MKISWFGHAMFLIQSDKGVRIVTDPYGQIGYKIPEVSADIVTVSHQHHDHNNIGSVGKSPKVIESTAGYSIADVSIEGISSFHDEVRGRERGTNIIFKFLIDGIKLVHMGDYGQPVLTAEQTSNLKGTDVLMIPVGGTYTVGPSQAAGIVRHLKPKVVFPMHYKTKHWGNKIASVEEFLAEMQGVPVKHKGDTVEISVSALPKATEIWTMEYIQ
jgi:L-ascorbate metabolism protein UlaG (beta-lactamase superfamily)